MEHWIERLVEKDTIIPILAIVLGCGVGALWIVAATIHSAARSRQTEQTKREIAAYVAEGSIDARTAIAILNAGPLESDQKVAKINVAMFDPPPASAKRT